MAVKDAVSVDPNDEDPRALDALRSHAIRVTLAESQRLALDLVVAAQ